MQTVRVTQDFSEPVEQLFGYFAEHENLGPVFGAKVRRLNDGTDGSRNGVGSAREMRIGLLPPFSETNVEVVPNELIRYRITNGGVLKNHEGVQRFTARGAASRLDWTISFESRLPGSGPLIKTKLTHDVSRALRKLAEARRAAGQEVDG